MLYISLGPKYVTPAETKPVYNMHILLIFTDAVSQVGFPESPKTKYHVKDIMRQNYMVS